MSINIGDIVNVRNMTNWDGKMYWKGKVTEIGNGGREITVQNKGVNFAVIYIDDLIFKDEEYWEK